MSTFSICMFWPTLYISTVSDLVKAYLSLLRCYLGHFCAVIWSDQGDTLR